ncbi:hypothetical protein V6N13_114348 [Hibiscus sabdariffa]
MITRTLDAYSATRLLGSNKGAKVVSPEDFARALAIDTCCFVSARDKASQLVQPKNMKYTYAKRHTQLRQIKAPKHSHDLHFSITRTRDSFSEVVVVNSPKSFARLLMFSGDNQSLQGHEQYMALQ